ncbi:HD superfamily phosphohydrolase [Flammeovirgaceae bacterium 311]|nr:HD superfamily phosphohydrolase [Flammeovirgaceae bacterium 311]
MNKKKIFNDPVYGFVTISSELIFDLIEHPFFQRLRRIKQLGLTDMVYPGALHTRFHHAIGAMHLMSITLDNLRSKGHEISQEEYVASQIAILLHDVGHGPFSHALEFSLLKGIRHEHLSLLLMHYFNKLFNGELELAIKIFTGQYERRFFHQLVSSQLDIDRLDYLQRDSMFTGVSEGTIGADRIIKMLDVVNDQIVVEEKGIYSIENFLSARRLMYWQVYLHKATVSSEKMLIMLIKRAKYLNNQGVGLFATPALQVFLEQDVHLEDIAANVEILKAFASLDDYDIWAAIKVWANHPDRILASLSAMILERRLFRVILSSQKFNKEAIEDLKLRISDNYNIQHNELKYFLACGSMSNAAYVAGGQHINILTKKGKVVDVAQASDLPNIKAMSKIVKKYYICWPKQISMEKALFI